MGDSHEADTDADVVITAAGGPAQFGYSLAVGDFNGDGMDDIAIGAPALSNPINSIFDYTSLINSANVPSTEGMVYLYDGSLLATTMSEADANGVIMSNEANAFGITVLAGDMNGDGKADLWVGEPMYNGDEGRAALFIMP